MKKILISLLVIASAVACKTDQKEKPIAKPYQLNQTIYFGGDIITMRGDKPEYVESVVQREGKIIFAGAKKDAMSRFKGKAKEHNLNGKTMLPGFIDGHGHVFNVGLQALSANLLPAPDGEANTVEDIKKLLKDWISKNSDFIKKTGWVIGFGYDDSQLDRYPTKNDLDEISEEYPVIIIHQSGHLSVVNSKALELVGYNANTQDPKGGKIRRMEGSNEPNGVLEEIAHFNVLIAKFLPKMTTELQDEMLVKGQKLYASFGYTTAQEGRSTPDGTAAMERASKSNSLILDIVSYPDILSNRVAATSKYQGNKYINKYRVGGVKLNLDGSPQGKTAWLTHAYHKPPEGEGKDYHGYESMSDEEAYKHVADAYQNNWQIMSHCNGDAAIDQYLKAVTRANKEFGNNDRRTIIIHAQTAREDQVERFAKEKIFPSFFPMHTFYWGDWHVNSVLGKERAYKISPTNTALKYGLKFTSHHDAPVALPSSIRVLSATVTRVSRSGDIIGPDERVSAYIGLKALTDWAAYQHFEEASKGTIEKGKVADFVILDKNPLKIKTSELENLKVIETIKDGEPVYLR
ncbi:hydrolase [Tenacibaculum sp. SZ-18]|uniref:amidohydrolase n=1 Tax=Tenacibaculum sp. SZ-18 TaxID=754423 RepID=UPI000C2CF55C|nr:amidohydrolase [Tenacibaculum sp. SZ-18]AUC16286.1 hydrolase [Tenacibaculum sp. SZ-18]